MAYLAITTRFLGPTNYRGARIKATIPDYARGDTRKRPSVTLGWDHALTAEGNHAAAARALALKLGWTGDYHLGDNGESYIFVRVSEYDDAPFFSIIKETFSRRSDASQRGACRPSTMRQARSQITGEPIMCEVNVSCLLDEVDPFDLSHSAAEAGSPNKWSDALEIAEGRTLPGLDVDNAKEYFAGFGAWSRDEIAAWSEQEVVALVLQFAAGDLREAQSCCPGDGIGDIDWDDFRDQAEAGRIGGRIYAANGELFISICD
jgi:hypothetical protein